MFENAIVKAGTKFLTATEDEAVAIVDIPVSVVYLSFEAGEASCYEDESGDLYYVAVEEES